MVSCHSSVTDDIDWNTALHDCFNVKNINYWYNVRDSWRVRLISVTWLVSRERKQFVIGVMWIEINRNGCHMSKSNFSLVSCEQTQLIIGVMWIEMIRNWCHVIKNESSLVSCEWNHLCLVPLNKKQFTSVMWTKSIHGMVSCEKKIFIGVMWTKLINDLVSCQQKNHDWVSC